MLCVEVVLSARPRGASRPPLAVRQIQGKTPGAPRGSGSAHHTTGQQPPMGQLSLLHGCQLSQLLLQVLSPPGLHLRRRPTCPGWIWILSSLWPASSKSNEDMSVR